MQNMYSTYYIIIIDVKYMNFVSEYYTNSILTCNKYKYSIVISFTQVKFIAKQKLRYVDIIITN